MIIVLVEGQGDKLSLPVLVKRESQQAALRCIDMKGKPNIVRQEGGFEDTIRRQHALGGRSFLVVIDGDVFYPPYQSLDQEREHLVLRAQTLAEELDITIQVRWAVLALESWLIGGLQVKSSYCGLQRIGQIPANTETAPANPKQWLRDRLRVDYEPRTQECLAKNIDLTTAKKRNQSLREFLAAVRPPA
jgi:hypothetical protein